MKTRLLLCGILCLAFLFSTFVPTFAQDEEEDQFIGLVTSGDKEMRSLVLDMLRTDMPGEDVTKRYAALLPQLKSDGQTALLSALADRGDGVARPDVLALLKSTEDAAVKVAAIKAIGFLGQLEDLQLLIDTWTKGDEDEKAAATSSLVRLKGEAVLPAMAAAMKKAPQATHVELLDILVTRRALVTIPAILEDAIGDDPVIRGAAMTALGQLASTDNLPGMLQGVLKAAEGKEREAAEKCVMFVCNRIEDPEKRAEPLLAAIMAVDPTQQALLLPTLGRVGGAKALAVIQPVVASTNAQLREIGVKALSNWPDQSIAPLLIQLIQSPQYAKYRTTTLRALIRIAPLSGKLDDKERLKLLWYAMSLCQRDSERNLVLGRATAIRTVDSLKFVLPYLDYAPCAKQACQSVVELAHHRGLREPNKDLFDPALDKVKEISKDPVILDRVRRYKAGETWSADMMD